MTKKEEEKIERVPIVSDNGIDPDGLVSTGQKEEEEELEKWAKYQKDIQARELLKPPDPQHIIFNIKKLKEDGVLGAWTKLSQKHVLLFSNMEVKQAAINPNDTRLLTQVFIDSFCMFSRSEDRGGLDDAVSLVKLKQEEEANAQAEHQD